MIVGAMFVILFGLTLLGSDMLILAHNLYFIMFTLWFYDSYAYD